MVKALDHHGGTSLVLPLSWLICPRMVVIGELGHWILGAVEYKS